MYYVFMLIVLWIIKEKENYICPVERLALYSRTEQKVFRTVQGRKVVLWSSVVQIIYQPYISWREKRKREIAIPNYFNTYMLTVSVMIYAIQQVALMQRIR